MSADGPVTITDAAVRAARRLRRRRGRAEAGRLLVEGPNAVDEALHLLERVFVTAEPSPRVAETLARCQRAGLPVVTVTDRALDALADARTPQGIVGVAVRPAAALDRLDAATLLVVLDQVADPGNLGTVVRTADAAGADAVVLTRGSVDPTNAKAVRASAGSMFHLPVIDDVDPDDLASHCRARGIRLVAAVADGEQRYDDVSWEEAAAIVFGNESHGLSPQMAHHVTTRVAVPIRRPMREGYRGHAESLNLATTAAVVVYDVARQRGRRDRTWDR